MSRQKLHPLWSPSPERIAASTMAHFRQWCEHLYKIPLPDPQAFHAWTVEEPDDFWVTVWDFCDVKGVRGARCLVHRHDMLKARFFPDATLNFARNLLSRHGHDDALVFRGEDKVEYRWSWDELHSHVSRFQQAFIAHGVAAGDRVAAMMPNIPETVALMLAAASIGAVWSSCSPDFGEQGVLDRFGQINPKLFIACDGYWYNGKFQDVRDKVCAVAETLACATVIVHYAGDADAVSQRTPRIFTLEQFTQPYSARAVEFTELPFSHPLYILFSSGTTGVPKCIVHSAGGTLLQHLKEHRLHSDTRPGDRIFYFTTCGWMMWNWLVSGLACGATVCLFDGSPFAPDAGVLWRYAEAEQFSLFGTSAKYVDALRKGGERPGETHDLSNLRLIASTGSPLSPESFDYIYQDIKQDVQLASISGGTDIVSCFVLGNPELPVWRGEIQGPGLGLAVDVWDEAGRSVRAQKGELVCTKPFPAMPIGFWNDDNDLKYRAAYFSRFDNVWCHGDFAEVTWHGSMIIHGRSDATLNPGGVRIGTAEIYNQVEQLDFVREAICVGQDFEDDVRIVLFVRMADGEDLDERRIGEIKAKIRAGASPRHMPAKVIAVDDIPRTKSGKIVELAVREVIHGREVKNIDALANPEALGLFQNLAELRN